MAIDRIFGIAVLSGKGGVGKSVIASNLALAMASRGLKTVLFDAGGGDLTHLTNSGDMSSEELPNFAKLNMQSAGNNLSLYRSSITDAYSISDESDIENFLSEIVEASNDCQCMVFDCLTGAGPIAYTLAGISEVSLLVSTPDPTSVAGTYLLAKALHNDGLVARSQLLFNQVESADEAASLKTRFDILSGKFLHRKFTMAGYIRSDAAIAESVIEQIPLLVGNSLSRSGSDFYSLADKMVSTGKLQSETGILKRQPKH